MHSQKRLGVRTCAIISQVMRKEVELLRGNVSGAEVVTKAVKKKLYDCNDKLRELQDQFKAADAMRQEAYQQLKSLRAQLREKVSGISI